MGLHRTRFRWTAHKTPDNGPDQWEVLNGNRDPDRPLESEELDYGCRFLARYSVELPRASGYRVEFGPPEPRDRPRGGYFQGAEDLGPQSISYQELEERGFDWSFEAEPARRPLTLRDSGIRRAD